MLSLIAKNGTIFFFSKSGYCFLIAIEQQAGMALVDRRPSLPFAPTG